MDRGLPVGCPQYPLHLDRLPHARTPRGRHARLLSSRAMPASDVIPAACISWTSGSPWPARFRAVSVLALAAAALLAPLGVCPR